MQRLRVDAGLSQERVAHLAGISRNHYQLLERGLSDRKKDTPSNPTLTTLMDVATVLNCPLDTLLADFIDRQRGTVVTFPAPGRTEAEPTIRAAARNAPPSSTVPRPRKS